MGSLEIGQAALFLGKIEWQGIATKGMGAAAYPHESG